MSSTDPLKRPARVERWSGGRLAKGYGTFARWYAERVARAASEKHPRDLVIVTPEDPSPEHQTEREPR